MFKSLPLVDKIFAIFILITTFSICWMDIYLRSPTAVIAFIYAVASTGQLFLLKKRRETKTLKMGFAGMCLLMLGVHIIIRYFLYAIAIGISWSGKDFPAWYEAVFWLSGLMTVANSLYVIEAIVKPWTNE